MLPTLPDFQLLFDALPTPYLALASPSLTVVAANAASQAAVGLEVPLLGRAAPELFGATEAAWQAALKTTGMGCPLPVYLSRPEGQAGAYDVCCWHLMLTPVRLPTGEVHYWLCQLQEQPAMRMEVKAASSLELESEQFRFLAEFIPQLVWITDANGRYQYFNARWMAYTGHTVADGDVPGLWRAMTHPDDQQRVRRQWRHSLTSGQAYEIEHRFRARNGSFRWFLSQALPQRDAAGNIVCWFGTSTDIDDQKRTRQLLEEKDQQLQQILSQVPAYIATLTGPNHVYRYVNERAQQLFRGQARVGLPAAQAAPELVEQGFIALIDDVYRTGQPFVLHEIPFHSTDQSAGREQWFFNGVFQPLLDEENQTQGILVFGIDVTEQVHAKQRAAELLEEIRYQDREFQQALESLPQMAWVSRPEGGVLYYNQRWYDFTGGTFENMREQGWENFIHPDDLPNTQRKWKAALRAGTTFETEHRWRSQTGEYRWFLARAEAIRREDGRILRWVGSNTDIDDKRLAQVRLEEKDRQLLQILSQAPASIATLEGPEHRLTFFNDSYSVFVGGRTELGRRVADLLPEVEEQGFIALLDDVYTTGQPRMVFETLIALKQPGTTTFRQHYVTFSYQPLHDEQHRVKGVLAFILDITEQVRSRQQSEALEAQIRRRDEQVRLMTESLPVMTFVCNPSGDIVYAGPQWYAFTGTSPATNDINGSWPELLHPDDLPTIRREYGAALQESRAWSYEFRLRRHDGQYRWILSRGIPEFDATGRVRCWYCTNTEVHEEHELREQLQAQNAELLRTNESLDNFVYTTSHDLRQPINNMAGIFQELIRTASFPDPDAVKLVAMFERALTQINDTIHDLSELIQVQKQRQYLDTERIDLTAFTAEVLASIQDQLTASGATVTTNFEAAPTIQFVRPSLQSVLYNLVSNALKYAAPDRQAHIQLSSYPLKNYVVLVVEDNGIGIDMARFGSQLFQLFRRFHDHVDGSGVGLYLVNRIVQSHGGRVEVESTVNEGAAFRVYLPL
ncbi:PAS domain-containing protein [Hymenobacter tibetensis]|uniref:histidine kinase n=1 Tax=Hymenobacter tibetensis TaxID=497967 RepID=A0ABY4CZZ7_9BACT|nr:PAS domain-containing protein [Hymenobacter tibetensis]UOG74534.1 PAS domain-containing protein [Hymenobacter tibetensis]